MENYSRVKQIGEGAFGKAILVRSKVSGEQAVIKEINISRMKAKEREDSRKEVAVLAQLKHPNIVTYRESFEERGSLFIVMDYCAGGDLYSKINNQRGLLFSEEQVWNWFIQTCLAIKHIHDRKILHRDIKSQNIFLTNDGRIQVGDFGIAKVLNSTVELARTCIGTPYYLSPEIVENKPYNNKSDIWSLGCVLYELSTLKHAFEAGNMKNLVLKIIRGSYPPIPPKYSYELRGLIAQLFKRAPRDRPSINAILKKNFIISRVRNLLPEEKMREEFSHTLLHGQKIARALPPPPRPASAGPKRVTPSPRPGSAAGRYNPAAVYGAPLARKSKERPDLKKKNGSGGRIIPGQQDWEKRKQDLVQKENKRREEAKKREQDLYAQKHKEFIDRQKMARINKAREEGWRNVIDSGDEDRSTPTPTPAVQRPMPKPVVAKPAEPSPKDRGNFDAYNDYLNKIRGNNNARVYEAPPVPAPRNNAGNYMAAPRGAPQPAVGKADRDYINRALQRGPAYNPVKQNEDNRRAIAQAEERSRLAEDFLQRKREAALNKKRGHAQLYGYTPPATPVPRPGSARRPGSSGGRGGGRGGGGGGVNARNREEQEYLEKLRQIREQNMKERRMLQGKVEAEKPNTPQDIEDRKKKMAALRKQAEEWSQKKKDQLEKEKKEILDRMKAREEYMKQREQEARKDRAETPRAQPNLKPVTPVPITGALHAIGVVEEKQPSPERPKSAVQQKKDEILKRLNNKQEKGRGQWESPQTPDLATEEEDGSETVRSQWGDGGNTHLANLPLEQTASQMEATSAGDRVVRVGVSSPQVVTPRNQWGKPGGTVVGVLQKLPICDATMTIDSNKSGGSTSSEGFEPHLSPSPAPAISSGVGATITISKSPVQKGTITIKAADASQAKAVKGVDSDTADKTLASNEQETIIETEAEAETCSENPEVFNDSMADKTEHKLNSERENEHENQSVDKANLSNQSEDKSNATDQSEQEKQDSKGTPESKQAATDQLEDLTEDDKQGDDESTGERVEEKCEVEEFKERVLHPGKTFDVFPKPRLLPKPDQPIQFSVKAPVVGRSEGAGSLFEKVELEEEEEETEKAGGDSKDGGKEKRKAEKEVEVDLSGDGNKFVTKGITTGQFDMNDVGLLRTASEPDLSKLGTAERITPATLSRHISMDLSVVQEETENLDNSDQEEEGSPDSTPIPSPKAAPVSPSRSPRERRREKQRASREESKNEKIETEKNDGDNKEVDDDDDDDEEEEDDYDDLMSVRETMQSLLIDDDSGSKIKFSLSNESESQEVEQKDSEGGRETEEEDKGDKEGGEEDDDVEEEDEEDDDDEEDELKNLEDDDEEGDRISTADLFDDSDGATEFGDDDQQEDEDLFSRLEQQRAELEAALGDKLIDVYKAVQAMQEDEDGNLEEGARIAMEMLGKQHEHLYPKIFQLVISDTAYTEDNV